MELWELTIRYNNSGQVEKLRSKDINDLVLYLRLNGGYKVLSIQQLNTEREDK